MLTTLQQQMLADFGDSYGYGRVLIGWNGQTEIFKDSTGSPLLPGPLDKKLFGTFVQQSYFLVSTQRAIKLYRGFETAGLSAPFGKDHPSYIFGVVARRDPGRPDGHWWMPKRPSISIDNLGLSDLHRGEDRADASILREWNRLDYYVEGELRTGSYVYVGRAAEQQESALYGRQRYRGGGIQFWLPQQPDRMLRNLKQYAAT